MLIFEKETNVFRFILINHTKYTILEVLLTLTHRLSFITCFCDEIHSMMSNISIKMHFIRFFMKKYFTENIEEKLEKSEKIIF